MLEKKQHGGKRIGSGRKKQDIHKKKWTGYLSEVTIAYLKSQTYSTISQGALVDHAIHELLKNLVKE